MGWMWICGIASKSRSKVICEKKLVILSPEKNRQNTNLLVRNGKYDMPTLW